MRIALLWILCWLCFPSLIFAQKKTASSQKAKRSPISKKSLLTLKQKKKVASSSKESESEEPMSSTVTVTSRAPEDAFQSTRTIIVLDKKRLREKRPRTTPEALMEEPGVFVQKTSHGGGAPIIRGAIGPQILILVDGIRLNASTNRSGPNQYLNLVDAWSLRGIEVLRGPGSIAFGGGAFGGVINLLTEKPVLELGRKPRYKVGLMGRYGSADQERSGRIVLGGGLLGIGVRAGVTFGDFGDLRAGGGAQTDSRLGLLKRKDAYGDLVTSGDTGAQVFSAYQNLYVDAKVRWRISSRWSATALYQHAQVFNAGRTDQLASKNDVRFYDNTRELAYLRLRGKFLPLRTTLRLTLSYQKQLEFVRRWRLHADDLSIKKETRYDDRVKIFGVSLDGHTALGQWLKLSYGSDFYYDQVESSRTVNGKVALANYPDGSSYGRLGGFLLAKVKLFGKKDMAFGSDGLYLHVGDRLAGFLAEAPARGSAGLKETSFSQFGNSLHASLQWLAFQSFNLSFSYAEGFRAPNLQETVSIGDMGNSFEIPNPELKPEVSRTLELMLKLRLKRRLLLWASLYYSFWQDLIAREKAAHKGSTTVDGKPVERRINQASANVYGVEAGASFRILPHWSLSAQTTLTVGLANKEDGSTESLSRIPPLFATVSTRYRFGQKGFLELFALIADAQRELSKRDQRDVRIPKGGTPGWWTLNLRGGVQFSDFVRVSLTIENMLDVRYKYHASGIFAAGLSGRISLELFQ